MYNPDKMYNTLLPRLRKLEKYRVEVLAKKNMARKTCSVLAGFVLFFTIVMSVKAFSVGAFVAVLGGLCVFGVYRMITFHYKEQFDSNYKNKIVRSIAHHVDYNLTYTADEGHCPSVLCDTKHYTNMIDRYKAEDFFQGTRGSREFSFSEMHAEQEVHNGERRYWVTIFKGVLFKADFNKRMSSWVTVRPDKESGVIGWVGTKIQKFNKSIIRMDDQSFEENFKVTTGNEKEAREILTPDMQLRLLKIKRNFGKDVMISFRDGSVYVTIPSNENRFESSLDVSATSEDQVLRIASEIRYYLNLVEDLSPVDRTYLNVS